MTDRHTLLLDSRAALDKLRALPAWAEKRLGEGWRLILTCQRTNEQNKRLHAMLDDIRDHWRETGQRVRTREHMKAVFMNALGEELQAGDDFYHGSGAVIIGYRTSELDKDSCSALMELISQWCAERNIPLRDEPEAPQTPASERS